MNKGKTGGPAFTDWMELPEGWPTKQFKFTSIRGSMTLLDYFAAKAMQSLCEHGLNRNSEHGQWIGDKYIADKAYDIAKAMIEEKRKREKNDPTQDD